MPQATILILYFHHNFFKCKFYCIYCIYCYYCIYCIIVYTVAHIGKKNVKAFFSEKGREIKLKNRRPWQMCSYHLYTTRWLRAKIGLWKIALTGYIAAADIVTTTADIDCRYRNHGSQIVNVWTWHFKTSYKDLPSLWLFWTPLFSYTKCWSVK